VGKLGAGTGMVISGPAGVDCGATCSNSFPNGSLVTVTGPVPVSDTFDPT
jgi:hypothetical protein